MEFKPSKEWMDNFISRHKPPDYSLGSTIELVESISTSRLSVDGSIDGVHPSEFGLELMSSSESLHCFSSKYKIIDLDKFSCFLLSSGELLG